MIKRLVVLVGLLLAGVSLGGFPAATVAAPHISSTVLITEVYAPNTTYNSQYFELYNKSNAAIDLSSYVIYNSGGSDNLSVLSNPVIQPGHFLAIGATLFPPTSTIGSGLSPVADFLALVQHSGSQDTVIDVVNWGQPNPNWPNYYRFQQYFFSGTAPTMPTDTTMSLQRYPYFQDTDQASDWVALPRSPSNPPPTFTPTATASPTASPVGTTATVTPTAFCTDAYGRDNTPSLALSLVLGTEQPNHAICPNGDEDWFKINVVTDKVYTLYTKDLGGGLDTIMAVYTYPYDGTKIAENDDQVNPPCLCSRIDMSFPTSGVYLVRVRDNRGLGGLGWTYTVGFTATPGPAPTGTPSFTPTPNPNAPSATPTSAACLDAYEPDGTPNSANLLLIGEVQRNHTLCPAGDADWYKFFGGRGKAYTIATSNLGVGVDTYMYLFDSDGKTVIAQNDDITGPPPSGNPNDVVSSAIQFFPIRDDFYYIFVKNKGDLGAPFMTYDISQKIQANVPPPAGSTTPVIAPVVTVTFPPTAAPPTSFPLPTNPPPATAAPPSPMPLPTAPPTAGVPPLPTATAQPTVAQSQPTATATPSSGTGGVIGTTPPAPPTASPVVETPGPGQLPTVGPIVPLPATGNSPVLVSVPLAVYLDRTGTHHYTAAAGVYGLRVLFLDEDGTPFASAVTDRQGLARMVLPRGAGARVAIPYLRWTGSVPVAANGVLVGLPAVALPVRIP